MIFYEAMSDGKIFGKLKFNIQSLLKQQKHGGVKRQEEGWCVNTIPHCSRGFKSHSSKKETCLYGNIQSKTVASSADFVNFTEVMQGWKVLQ